MKISVAMIVYNGALFLEEALASVFVQSRPPDEIIVWDDGSTDATPEILAGKKCRLRWIRGKTNQGAVVEEASNSRIVFLDADDRFHEEAIASFEAIASSNRNIDMIFGKMRNFFDLEGGKTEEQNGGKWQQGRTNGNLFVKREAFLTASCRVQGKPRAEFVSWYQAAKEVGLSELDFDAPILERRIHAANASRHPETKRELFTSLRQHLEAKRRGEST